LLDPGNEDDRTFLIEARHKEFEDALASDEDLITDDEPFSSQTAYSDAPSRREPIAGRRPPDTWQTVQRLAGLGYDWRNVMHMIASLVTEDIYRAIKEHQQPDPGDHARRLNELPGNWRHPRGARPG
jgi:hypothetical protein